MELYSKNNHYTLYKGNMLDMLEHIEPNSIDAIVTDPPYELGFMGKSWDQSGIAFQKSTWDKCFDVLKPGGHLLAFGGGRTYHRICCAIEDAGFEIRDCIMWIYGSGFPKSMNIGKAIEAKEKLGNSGTRNKRIIEQLCDSEEYSVKHPYNGIFGEIVESTRKEYIPGTELAKKWSGWGSSLKPAYEPIIVARKPCDGTCTDNVIKWGVGGINIEECRVGDDYIDGGTMPDFQDVGHKNAQMGGLNKIGKTNVGNSLRKECDGHYGRFPANLILTYDNSDFDEVCGRMPLENGVSASRYFYSAKASKRDRDEGLDKFSDKKKVFNGTSSESSKNIHDVEQRFTTICKNTHPTVKPTSLMSYLVRLVTPKGGIVLDPFMGSGSTGKATMYENNDRNANYKFVGIELTDEYLPIAKARIDYAIEDKSSIIEEVEQQVEQQQKGGKKKLW